jgi:PAS domain S-box-containing protein
LIEKFKDLVFDPLWYFTILKSIGDAVIATDKEGKVVFLNSVAESLTGWSHEEANGRYLEEVFNIINEKTRKKVENPVSKVLASGNVVGLANHTLLINKSGKEIPIDDSGAPIKNEEGLITGVVLVFRDITERKLARLRLIESEQKFRNVFESIPIGLHYYELDKNENLIFKGANPPADKILNIDNSQFVNLTIEEAFPPLIETDIPRRYRELAKKEGSWKWDQVAYEDNKIKGAYEVLAFHTSPGNMVTSFADITERLETERKLKESEEMYRESFNQAQFYKDLFAHDINNILQNVQSSIDTLILAEKNHDWKSVFGEMTEIIKEQVNRGAMLVSNVRTLSNITDPKQSLKPIDVDHFLEAAIKFINEGHKNKDIDVRIESVIENPQVYANELMLDVFENLLINSLKYNEEPKVEITIKISGETMNDNQYIKLEFIDNGFGIKDERKKSIFQRTESKSVSGMGLGLSLVNHIISKYRGKTWVEDRIKGDYSKGSNFVLLIPEVIKD